MLATIGWGVWGEAKLPTSGARKRRLSGPPPWRRGQRTDDDAAIIGPACRSAHREVPSSSREERQSSRSRLPLGRRGSGNCSLTNAEERLAPRTNSGGASFAGDDWEGVWGRRSLPRLEEGGLQPTDDCLQGAACCSVHLSRCSLLHRPPSPWVAPPP